MKSKFRDKVIWKGKKAVVWAWDEGKIIIILEDESIATVKPSELRRG